MHLIRPVAIVVAGIVVMLACTSHHVHRFENKVELVIQPYKGMSDTDLETVRKGVAHLYHLDLRILPQRDLPASAFYTPRQRYRAALLLDDLQTIGSPASKVVGLTNADISASRGEIDDWGIFGFGLVGGKSSVVSAFRLRGEGVNRSLYEARLRKVANHEIGHTLGLEHCDHESCLMQDANGKIRTIDKMSGTLCARCAAKIAPYLVQRSG